MDGEQHYVRTHHGKLQSMNLDQLFHLLHEAKKLSNHNDFVIVGSLSVLGILNDDKSPSSMTQSNDLDCYTKSDPGKIFDLVKDLGEGSPYEKATSFYLDPVSPYLPTLPDNWESRLLRIDRNNLVAWFLEPNDAAISKYARGEPRDLSWLRAGITNGIISLPTVRYRFNETTFLDDNERLATLERIDTDIQWFEDIKKIRSNFRPK